MWLTDSGDNPTAGTPGDSTYFLTRMLERKIPDAIFASIPDEIAWRTCAEAGEGATVQLNLEDRQPCFAESFAYEPARCQPPRTRRSCRDGPLGARWDNRNAGPVALSGVVEHLYTGDAAAKISPIATVNSGGVRVVVTGLRKSMTTLDDFHNAGLDPLAHKIVVVKLGYLMPQLRDVAPREILVLTPGYADMELERLPFKYVTRPVYPLDRDFDWRPRISNVAGFVD